MQIRLTKVLMKLVSLEHYAYLPGYSIHHGMLLANEMVAKAKKLPKQYVWLRVEVIKAFEKLEWRFMVLLMYGIGVDKG
jgi:hypothetical protein